MKPIIGIIVCGVCDNRQFVTSSYIKAVEDFGGLPVLLPLLTSGTPAYMQKLHSYAEFCDGFLFCGGDDLTPILFHQELAFGSGSTDYALDQFQLLLMKQILNTKKPVLAICRGMQVLNVACGGSIYQDIHLQPGKPFNHMQHSSLRSDISHEVTLSPGTLAANIFGTHVYTNSYHHQTIAKVGKRLIASGTTSDGTIEVLEMPSHTFVIGVQWHPECLYPGSKKMRRLFREFITKSKKSKKLPNA